MHLDKDEIKRICKEEQVANIIVPSSTLTELTKSISPKICEKQTS